MRITKISQTVSRTIQLDDLNFVKLGITKEAELEPGEVGQQAQADLFDVARMELNAQAKILLKK